MNEMPAGKRCPGLKSCDTHGRSRHKLQARTGTFCCATPYYQKHVKRSYSQARGTSCITDVCMCLCPPLSRRLRPLAALQRHNCSVASITNVQVHFATHHPRKWCSSKAVQRSTPTNAALRKCLVQSSIATYPTSQLTPREALLKKSRDLQHLLDLSNKEIEILLSRAPGLLVLDTDTLQHRLAGTAKVFRVGSSKAAALVVRQPDLLMLDPDRSEERLRTLEAKLEVTRLWLQEVVVKYPTLLHQHPDVTLSKATLLAELLHISMKQLMSLVRAHPAILGQRACTSARRLEGLATDFQISMEEARTLVISQPGLILQNHANRVAKIRMLSEALGMEQACVVLMLKQLPPLVLLNTERLQEKIESICQILQLSRAAVGRLIRKSPNYLGLHIGTLPARMSILTVILNRPLDEVRKAVVNAPRVIAVTPEVLQARYSGILQRVEQSPEWKTGLKKLSAGSLVGLLMMRDTKVHRLDYLLDHPELRKPGLTSIYSMSDATFAASYPDFPQWLAERHGVALAASTFPAAYASLIGHGLA